MDAIRKPSIRTEKRQDVDVIYFSGPIDEEAGLHLMPLYDRVGKKVMFNFRDVSVVNSNGIRCWVLFLRDFKNERTVEFEECAPVVVSQMNMLPSFRQKMTVRSVYVPFTCSSCKLVANELYLAKDFPQETSALKSGRCKKCGSSTTTEDVEDDYFGFVDI